MLPLIVVVAELVPLVVVEVEPAPPLAPRSGCPLFPAALPIDAGAGAGVCGGLLGAVVAAVVAAGTGAVVCGGLLGAVVAAGAGAGAGALMASSKAAKGGVSLCCVGVVACDHCGDR